MVRSSLRSRRSFRAGVLATAVAACYAAAPAWSQLPVNPVVTAGSATFSQVDKVLTVTNSAGTTINWDKFSIDAGYTTHFAQTSASSAVLNRVVTADPSKIYGTLSSNGQVWLINPAGILVGNGGVVDTARFVASTLKVGDTDFAAGRLNFQATPGAGALDIEAGAKITTPSGGAVYLIGANVSNQGTITTPGGETILAAGETVSLIDTGTPGVKVEITGAAGNVTNLGEIAASAGRIGMAGVIVKNTGTLNASSVVSEGGRIFLKASKDTYVDGAGRIVATGTQGGRVEVLGERVAVMGQAQIDASGTHGGGTVLVGGDYQGKNADVRNADITYFGKEASIKADAGTNGDGGKVILWADDTTRAYGHISARGGSFGGNGGFVETSGKKFLDIAGARVDTRAPNGKTGSWLLDPMDVEIVSGAYAGAVSGDPFAPSGGTTTTLTSADIADFLTGSNLTIQTDGAGSGSGNISITNASISGGATTLTLLAYGGQGGTGNITISGSTLLFPTGGLTLVAGWSGTGMDTIAGTGDVSITASTINMGTSVDFRAGRDVLVAAGSSGTAIWAGGNLMFVAGRNIQATGGSASNNTAQDRGVFVGSGSAMSLSANNGSGEIALLGGTANNTSYGGQYSYGGSVIFQSQGNQYLGANRVRLVGGASGHDNAAVLEAYGSQYITVYGGGLWLQGGGSAGSYNNSARISQNGPAGSQTVTVFSGGTVALYGGAGTGTGGYYDSKCGTPCAGNSSHNSADIHNKGTGGQIFDFIQGGAIALYGGSSGTSNDASIDNDAASMQKIWSSTGSSANYPIIYVQGGSGGAVVYGGSSFGGTGPNRYYHLENGAGISSGDDGVNGNQDIYASGITLVGGGNGTTIGGAYLGAEGLQKIISYGSVTLTGGAGNAVTGADFGAPAAIGSEEDADITLAIYGGSLTLAGGSGNASPVLIGSLHYGANVSIGVYGGGDIVMTGNTGGVAVGSYRKAGEAGTPLDTSVTMRTGGNITAGGNVRIGAFDGQLAAVGVAMVAGKNITLNGVKVGTDSSPGASTIDIKAGLNTAGSGGSASGGDLSLVGTTVYGNSVNLQAYGGSLATGSVTVDSASGVYGSSVSLVATNNLSLNGILRAGSILGVGAGYYDNAFTSKSVNGGNISMGAGAIAYGGTSLSFRASAGSTLNAGAGQIGLTRLESPLIQVYADRQILDNNGAGVANAVGQTIGLHSLYGGIAGALAVSADVEVSGLTSSLGASVGASAVYGGISLRNVGSAEASSLSMTDSSGSAGYGNLYYQSGNSINMMAGPYSLSSNNGGVFIQSNGTVTLGSLASIAPGQSNAAYRYIDIWGQTGMSSGANIALSGAPDLFLGTGGTLNLGHSLSGAGNLGLYSGGAMNITANLSAAYDVGLWSTGGLSLTNSTVTATGGSAYLGSAALVFDADGGLSHTGGGGISLNNSAIKALSGDIFGYTGGDIRLNNGSYFQSGYSIYLDLAGTTSTLYLNDTTGYPASYLLAGSPTTIDLEFLARAADGVVIDGVATTTSTPGGSGLFVGNHSTPASVGAGLQLAYGVVASETVTPVVSDVINTINTTTTNTPTGSTTTTDTSSLPPPVTTTTGTTSLTSLSSGTVGGGAGEFGGSDTTSSTTGTTATGSTGESGSGTSAGESSQTSSATGEDSKSGGDQDAKDDKSKKDDKKADSGEKKDDKPSKKPVGKCSA